MCSRIYDSRNYQVRIDLKDEYQKNFPIYDSRNYQVRIDDMLESIVTDVSTIVEIIKSV